MEASPAGSDATAATITTTTTVDAPTLVRPRDFGKMEFGCNHYKRRCKIRAPCCNEVFMCRHCHNESVADLHFLPRHVIQRVICLVCDTEQPPAQVCSSCGVNMGEYFCGICQVYDDDAQNRRYHCDDCGICRIGPRENFFHCQKCGCCSSVRLHKKQRLCIENITRHHCHVCSEYLFDSVEMVDLLDCHHIVDLDSLSEMCRHGRCECPVCSKPIVGALTVCKKLDKEVEETIIPKEYRAKKVWILCNDCNGQSEVEHKCGHCASYNTWSIVPPERIEPRGRIHQLAIRHLNRIRSFLPSPTRYKTSVPKGRRRWGCWLF